MGGDDPPVQQSGLGQQERPGAHRADPTDPGGGAAQPVEDPGVGTRLSRTDAAGNQNGVESAGLKPGEGGIGEQGGADAGGDRPALQPDQPAAEIGRAHVRTPVTNANLVCSLLLEKKNTMTRT